MIDRAIRFLFPFLLIGVACMLVAGVIYRMGYDAHKAETLATELHATQGALHQQWDNLTDASDRDDALEKKLAAAEALNTSLRPQLGRRLAAQAAIPYQPLTPEGLPNETPPLIGQCVVDPESVRLLNDARRGAASEASAAAQGDGEVPAAAGAAH